MSGYLGDYATGSTVDFTFTTLHPTTREPAALSSGALAVYKANGTTENTDGITLTASFDGVTGLNHVRITLSSDATFYAAGSDFSIVFTAGTVAGVSVVGETLRTFSIVNRVAKLADGVTHGGTTALVRLKQLNVTSGDSTVPLVIAANSTDGIAADIDGGIEVSTSGLTHGVSVATGSGYALSLTSLDLGNTSGGVVYIACAGTGHGIYAAGGPTAGSGIYGVTSANGLEDSGIYGKCTGLLGSGIYGEATQGGHGGWFQAEGTGSGLFVCSLGPGSAFKTQGGTTGIGFEAVGGASGGDGMHARARAGNADGFQAAKHGTGADIRGDVTGTVATVTTLTNAPSDSSGITTLLGKFTGITLLAQWLGLIAGKQTGNSTARTELRATGAGSGTYDETTDSLQAIKDVGVPATGLPATPPSGYGTVTITPIQASTSNARISSRKLPPIPKGSSPLDVVNVTDGAGAAVDLSAMTLRMVVASTTDEGEEDDRTDDEIEALYKYESGDGLTVQGDDDNQIAIQHDAANTGTCGHYRYWVYNITDADQPVPLLKGTFDVEPAVTDA